jgi:ketosteroid isomerase-like protein
MSVTRELAEKLARAFEELRFIDGFNMLAEEGTYTVIGTTKVSGIYHGRSDVLIRLVPVLATFTSPPALKFSNIVVDGDRAVLLASGAGNGPTGPYHQPYYAFSIRVAKDEIVEIVEFMDTTMLDTAVFGKKIVDA